MALLDRWRRKDPATKGALDFSSPNFLEMLRSGDSTATISEEQAMRISAVYACNRVLSETIKTLPCKLYRHRDGEKVEQPDHELTRLVQDAPNEYQTASEFWEQAVTALNLNGNFYAFVVRAGERRRVVSLLPIPTTAVSPQVLGGRLVAYQITNGDKTDMVMPEDMLHIRGLSLDGITGISPIKYNAATLTQSVNARDFAASVFTNGGTPRGILTTDNTLSDEAYANIRESWAASHEGVGNSNRVALLEAGLRFEKISMSPDDVQLLDTRKLSRAEIAGMYRVPPHMIADLDRSTFNNIAHQSLDFYKSSISPWLTNFEQRLNFTLTPKDRNLKFRFDVSELIRGDFAGEVASYIQLIAAGVLNSNEVRDRIGYNPRPGGEEFVDTNVAPVEPDEDNDGEEPQEEDTNDDLN